jgi:hypothetical protein
VGLVWANVRINLLNRRAAWPFEKVVPLDVKQQLDKNLQDKRGHIVACKLLVAVYGCNLAAGNKSNFFKSPCDRRIRRRDAYKPLPDYKSKAVDQRKTAIINAWAFEKVRFRQER